MASLGERLETASTTFPRERLETILHEARPFHPEGHFLYPADERGNHLQGYFLLEPVAADPRFARWIADDVVRWIGREGIEFEVLFAPAQPAVRTLAEAIARQAGVRSAFWDYLPSGRFGDRLVEGRVERGDRALVFNGVSHTGRCVGLRLPGFVESLGGKSVAAAVFAKGTAPKVAETERNLGNRFYSALRAEVPVFAPNGCPLCARTGPPVPWTTLLGRGTR
jgi:orotate phosphoribosyltransferase